MKYHVVYKGRILYKTNKLASAEACLAIHGPHGAKLVINF
jgi:hypothetical protein